MALGNIRHHKRLMKQFRTGWDKRTMMVEFSTLAIVMGLLVNDSIQFERKCLSCFPTFLKMKVLVIIQMLFLYTECHRRKGPNFGRVFLMLNYTNITQNTYIQSWTVSEIMSSEVWNFDSCYTLTDCQIHIETGRNMWFL